MTTNDIEAATAAWDNEHDSNTDSTDADMEIIKASLLKEYLLIKIVETPPKFEEEGEETIGMVVELPSVENLAVGFIVAAISTIAKRSDISTDEVLTKIIISMNSGLIENPKPFI